MLLFLELLKYENLPFARSETMLKQQIDRFFLTLALLFVGQMAFGGERVKFSTLSVDDGLSQSSVLSLSQDFQGNIWMGTQDGLNKWDGYGFTVYSADPNDNTALNDNMINALLCDQGGRLWIGTSVGLSCFDFHENRFYNYTLPERKIQVFDLVETGEGHLVLATDAGVVLFDLHDRVMKVKTYLSGISARTLCCAGTRVVIGTSNGLYTYAPAQGTITRILPQLSDYDIASVICTDKEYWIATHGNGLYRADAQMQITAHYDTRNSPGLVSDYIRVLKLDAENRLWVGTFDGLSIRDGQTGLFERYIRGSSTIGHNSIRSIFIDNQKGMWLGTYYGGVSYYHPLANKFGVLRVNEKTTSPADNTVSCIVEDPLTGNLWVGTNDQGLNYYDTQTGLFTRYDASMAHATGGERLSNNIKCILPDERGNVYVGTHAGGLNYLDRRTRHMEHYRINAVIPINNSCYALLEGKEGTLWVGTLNGLLSFDKQTKRFSRHAAADYEPKLASAQVMTLYRDTKHRVWIGTSAGLFLAQAEGGEIRAFSSLDASAQSKNMDHAFVLTVQEDSRHNIWIGTKEGLFRFNEANHTFSAFTVRDGLPNNVIYGILEDDLYRLWISTNNGLSCFDIQQNTFRNYHKTEGIANNQFNLYASCRDQKGSFYFGGLGGITYFRPYDLSDNPYAPMPQITGLTIFNRAPTEEDRVVVQRDSIGAVASIALSSKLNVFSIQFGVVNPLSGSRNHYAYKLEGFDADWYQTTHREVSYSNLAPGHYTFRIKAANNNDHWSVGEVSMKVHILPMWWQTVVARLFFFLLLLGLVGVIFWFLVGRMRMKLELTMERKEKDRIEALSQEKIRFYINLSHELRTPLTLILSPLQEIGEHGMVDKYTKTRLDYIYRSSSKLLHIVNQMLDYRKAELGMFRLQVAVQDVDAIVGEVFSLFEEVAQNRDMDYILNSELKGERLPVDRLFLEMILTNLLSNAFKFTAESSSVKLSLQHREGRLLITIWDSGIGIATEKQKDIFERFYQIDESRTGTGIGLSIVRRLVEQHLGSISLKSESGQFTEFTISLPATLEAYPEAVRVADESASTPMAQEDISLYLTDAYAVEELSHTDKTPSEELRESVLVVDADAEIRRYMADHFKGLYQIYVAADGQQALDMLKTIEPDVIVADQILPAIDGLKLCQMIKQNIRTCHIPIIILSAKDSVEDQITGIEAGADDYVAKPFSISLLQAKIAQLLKSKYRLQHYYSDSAEIEPDKITSNVLDGDFLKRAIAIVETNMDNEEFSSNDFARALCMSRSNLHLKMKSITGESSTKFIRKIRFNRACQLLLGRKHTIAEISCLVGFNSPSYFATSFKKHIGCLPTEYVRSHKGEKGE